jgi:hypothetical protein
LPYQKYQRKEKTAGNTKRKPVDSSTPSPGDDPEVLMLCTVALDVAVAAGLKLVVGPKVVSATEVVRADPVDAVLVDPRPDVETIIEDKTSMKY